MLNANEALRTSSFTYAPALQFYARMTIKGGFNLSQLLIRAFEDGGNPRLESDIIRTARGVLLRPFAEDGDTLCKFHLNVELVNPTESAIETEIEIEWFNDAYPELRDYLLLHSADGRLTWIPSTMTGSRQVATICVPPGAHCLCVNPRYETARVSRLLGALDKNRFTVKTIGTSRMGRDIYGVEIGNPSAKPIAIVSRIHPYETVSSFFIEGMLHWLNSADSDAFLQTRRLAFVPMPNPDGVALGYQKTTYGSAGLASNLMASVEEEPVALREYFLKLNPYLAAEFRGWLGRYDDPRPSGWLNRRHDLMKTNSIERGTACYKAMIPYSEGIGIEYPDTDIFDNPNDIGGLLQEQCGADYFTVSWTPRGRSIARLYEIGAAFLRAIAN